MKPKLLTAILQEARMKQPPLTAVRTERPARQR
jgi:hypothetical protein